MSATELNEDSLDMLDALRDAGVEFVVVGAHALAVHGIVRATGDLDIFVRPSVDNARRVLNALAAFGAPVAAHGVTETDLSTRGNVYEIGLPPRRIDLLTEISGVSFDEAIQHHVATDVAGRAIPFLGRDQLIKSKRASGRDKDLLDVAALQSQPG